MAIYEHYYEALDVMGEMFNFIFDGIAEKYTHELSVISQQYPFEVQLGHRHSTTLDLSPFSSFRAVPSQRSPSNT